MTKHILFYDKFFIQKIDTKENLKDVLTMSLPTEKLKLCLDLVEVRTGQDGRMDE